MKKSNIDTRVISFFRSKEKSDYYIIYSRSDPERMLKKMTHIDEFENSGYHHADVELAYIFKTDKLTFDGAEDFLRFISEQIATDHDSFEFYDCQIAKGWCKLETYEPDKWLKAFEDFKEQEEEERKQKREQERKENAKPVQLSLF